MKMKMLAMLLFTVSCLHATPYRTTDLYILSMNGTTIMFTCFVPRTLGSAQLEVEQIELRMDTVTDNILNADKYEQCRLVQVVNRPGPAGAKVTFTVENLQPHTRYYFACRAKDTQWSEVSNVITVTTLSAVNPPSVVVPPTNPPVVVPPIDPPVVGAPTNPRVVVTVVTPVDPPVVVPPVNPPVVVPPIDPSVTVTPISPPVAVKPATKTIRVKWTYKEDGGEIPDVVVILHGSTTALSDKPIAVSGNTYQADITGLPWGVIHYWQVTTVNAAGRTVESPLRSDSQ